MITPLNILCPTKYFVTGNPTYPNKAVREVMVLVLSFLPDKDKIGGTIHKDVHNNNNEFQISRAKNCVGRKYLKTVQS